MRSGMNNRCGETMLLGNDVEGIMIASCAGCDELVLVYDNPPRQLSCLLTGEAYDQAALPNDNSGQRVLLCSLCLENARAVANNERPLDLVAFREANRRSLAARLGPGGEAMTVEEADDLRPYYANAVASRKARERRGLLRLVRRVEP